MYFKGCEYGDRDSWCGKDASYRNAPICYVNNND